MYTLFQRGNRFLFFLATYSVRHTNISISSESTIQIRETHALYTHARRTSNSSYFAWKRRICNCRLATKMQMHVIITRRASSENLDAKELRFLSLGRSSSSCNETPRIVAGGRPKSGGRRLENKKKKKKIKKQTETKKRIRRWRVEKDPAKIMKLLYAKMYFSRGRCSRESKKKSLLHPNQLSLIPDSFHSFLPRVCIHHTRYILYFASSINWRVKQRSYSVENYTGVAFSFCNPCVT